MQDEKHFDEKAKLRVSERFSADLKSLYRPGTSIPAEIDRAIMARASEQINRKQKKAWIFRLSAGAAAAAAVIIFGMSLFIGNEAKEGAANLQVAVIQADVDQNGSVNILDAYKLARYLKSNEQPDAKLDMNGDGRVNQKDVDFVALAAVRL